MSYVGIPNTDASTITQADNTTVSRQRTVVGDPLDGVGLAPVDNVEGLTIQPGPDFQDKLDQMVRLLALNAKYLSELSGLSVDPDEALEEIL